MGTGWWLAVGRLVLSCWGGFGRRVFVAVACGFAAMQQASQKRLDEVYGLTRARFSARQLQERTGKSA